jgi:hypothetical protein
MRFSTTLFSKNVNKRKFLFISGGGYLEKRGKKKIQKSAKKLFFILLNSLRWK